MTPHGTGQTPAAILSSSMASRRGRTRSSSNWSTPTINRLINKWYGSPFLSGGNDMSTATPTSSTITARTQFLHAKNETYAYRRFGHGPGRPLLCLQHFMGTLDNWDPAVADVLASGREVILFDNAGVGRSTGNVPDTVQGMATHALTFLDGLGVTNCDVLGFSLGGMIAQQIAQDRPSMFRKMILVGTAPRGGEDIMHLEKPTLAKPLSDSTLRGYAVLQTDLLCADRIESGSGARRSSKAGATERGSRTGVGSGCGESPDGLVSRMGAIHGHALRRSEEHPSAGARRERRPRRNDSRVEFVLAGRAPARTRCCSRIPTLGMVPCSSITSPSRARRPRFSRRTLRLRPTEPPRRWS